MDGQLSIFYHEHLKSLIIDLTQSIDAELLNLKKKLNCMVKNCKVSQFLKRKPVAKRKYQRNLLMKLSMKKK